MGRRVLAYVVDAIILTAANAGIFFALAEKDTDVVRKLASGEYSATESTYGNVTIGDHDWAIVGGKFLVYLGIVFALFILYDWVLQGLTGWTPGKLMAGIRTVKADGTAPGIGKAIVRWFLWVADGFPYIVFGLLGFIVAMTNDRRQRIGDKVAGTYVVEARAMGRPVLAAGGPDDRPLPEA